MKDKTMTASEMGKRGNRARNKSLSAAQRKELAKRAAKARWSKAKE
jgi:hypothetical protein